MKAIQYEAEQTPLVIPLIEMIKGIPSGVGRTHLGIQSVGRKNTNIPLVWDAQKAARPTAQRYPKQNKNSA
jgi:hypothetical protein